ncbi:MAG: Uma2 family endonuclease [Bacteroidota bacterium]
MSYTKYVTPEQYLREEAVAYEKHEYFDGHVIAMAGATESHNRIVRNLVGELHGFLKGKTCEVFPSDIRVATPFSNSYTYPDVTIVCGDTEMKEEGFDTLTNPSVIIEVTSPSTRDIDLGPKMWKYLQIPSLKEYIIIDSTTYNARTIRRATDNTYELTNVDGPDGSIRINTIGLQLSFTDIYYKVTFEENH